ncbi:RagB/SusD family nutrient uptake outer membrane protein [Carboxylicivirga sediminis]|uniref:RagB/SusD family nutrient uptake outer membrane protein n=1 Tax=Carboxylicivirga sediminis TaxID=2006564 RepID=A0A941EYE7_9BACT|nr:RagB/SusD family nutrient uptake outer membrane protein [Carboxylicivirga sediminis]MBR8534111.1 RagB/SusD family nutrient uptake outer membrane protein [Carboxylicivirga sediminis]
MSLKNFKIGAFILMMSLASCSNELDTDYTTGQGGDNLKDLIREYPYKLKSLVDGLYLFMVSYQGDHDSFNYTMTLHATDMMAQDISQPTSHYFSWDYLHRYRSAPNVRTAYIWNTFYTAIANGNRLLDMADELSEYIIGYDEDFYNSCLAETYAVRGMSYLYLIQLYQEVITKEIVNLQAPGVPLYFSTLDGVAEEEAEALKGRNTVARVFEQIEHDLTLALQLSANYDRQDDKRSIDSHVIHGLLARYYMLSQQWQKAADHAKSAYSGYSLMDVEQLKSGFMDATNPEWIWGYRHTIETQTTLVSWFSHISNNSPGYAGILSPRLIDYELYHSIPDEDVRKQLFNGPEGISQEDYQRFKVDIQTAPNIQNPYASLKFGRKDDWTQDYPYMRAAEMILIEAEAYAHMGNTVMAAEVVRLLMENRQPGWDMSEVDVEYIYHQRRIELWGEGFSYFDLKRLYKGINRAYDNSNHSIPGQFEVAAGANNWVFQIPRREIQDNPQIDESEQND